jgi:hypothetical protein
MEKGESPTQMEDPPFSLSPQQTEHAALCLFFLQNSNATLYFTSDISSIQRIICIFAYMSFRQFENLKFHTYENIV